MNQDQIAHDIALLEERLRATADPVARLALHKNLFQLVSFGDAYQRLKVARRYLAEARRERDEVHIAMANVCMALSHMVLRNYTRAMEHLKRAERLYTQLGDEAGVVLVHRKMGTAMLDMMRIAEGIELMKSTVAPHYHEPSASSSSMVHYDIGVGYMRLSDFPNALEHFLIGLDLSRPSGPNSRIARHLLGIGNIYLELEDYQKARLYLEECFELFEEADHWGYCDALNDLGLVYAGLGERARARAFHTMALEIATRYNDPQAVAIAQHWLGELHYQMEEFAPALRYFRQAQESTSVLVRTMALGGLAKVHNGMGEPAEGISYAEAALALAEGTGNQKMASTCHKIIYEAFQQLGNPAEALQHYKRYREIEEAILGNEQQRQLRTIYLRAEVERVERNRQELLDSNTMLRQEIERKEHQLQQAAGGGTIAPPRQGRNGSEAGIPMRSWKDFEGYFQQLYPEFLRNLSRHCTELTPTELKVCAFIRSNLSTKEMADLLCIEPRSVEVYRTRIRRKLALGRPVNLATFLGGI